MCTTSLLRSGQLQSTLGFVKEAQIQPDPKEEPRGLGWQLVPDVLRASLFSSLNSSLTDLFYAYFTDP